MALVVVLVILFYLLAAIRILRQYERGVAASDVADHGRDIGREEFDDHLPGTVHDHGPGSDCDPVAGYRAMVATCTMPSLVFDPVQIRVAEEESLRSWIYEMPALVAFGWTGSR
jgi:hypothetical protein